MKILLITATFPPMSSGGADYAFRLCQQLSSRDVDIHVLTSKKTTAISMDNFHSYPIMDIWSWSELPRLLQTIRQVKPDVINLHFGGILYNDHPMIGFSATFAKWILPSARFVTLVEAASGLRPYLCSLPVRAVHKLVIALTKAYRVDYNYGTLLKDSDAIIVLSDSQRLELARYDQTILAKSYLLPVPPLMKIIDNTKVLREQGRRKLGVGGDQVLLAYIGYLYPGKGLENLLQAFKIVRQEKSNARLVIIGGVPEIVLTSMSRPHYREELLELSSQLGISEDIVWTGAYETDSEEASLYLRASDLAVLPFDQGVFLSNSSFASCAAHHLPIITTRGDYLESQFVDRENLVLVAPKDPKLLAQAILVTLVDVRLLERIADGAYELAKKVFSWSQTIEQTMAIFRGEKSTSLI